MSQWLAEKSSALLAARTSRRNFLVRSAMAGSALAVAPLRYLLRPVTAYAAICTCAGTSCDCASACCDGYTDFCCSINNGLNACPSGTFEAGWWRADGSAFCNGPRYFVDCNVSCGSSGSYPCRCGQGRCDHRRTGCNQFRYGNCNRQIECYGPIACRVVSCTPPYQTYPACDQTTLWDDSTANHTADCVTPPPSQRRPGNEVTVAHSGKALEVSGASQENGAAVWQWRRTGADNQRWAAEALGDSTYRIVAAHSGKVLDVAGFSTENGGFVHQWEWHGGANQRWRIEDAGDGTARVTSAHSGKVLDVSGVSEEDGARIHQWEWHGGANQRWRGLPLPAPPPARQGRQILAAHSNKALDVSAVSTANGAAVTQWTPNNGNNQRWTVERLADGTYRLIAVHSGKVLDVAGFSTANGGVVHQWEWHGGANQRWIVEDLRDGSFRVTSAHSGKVLEVAGFSTDDGAQVQQWEWHGGPSQRWLGVL